MGLETGKQDNQQEREGRGEEGGNPTTRKFALGRVVQTSTSVGQLNAEDVLMGLARHSLGDWGDLGKDDIAENELSLREGFRLFSVYHDRAGTRFYIITEADRDVTTVLLPDEY